MKITKEDLRGKIICFSTDTVIGVGALYDDMEGINKIYELKNRDYSKPLAVLIGKKEDVKLFSNEDNPKLNQLMSKYWPGALTIILKKDHDLACVKGLDTVGLRMPNSKIALELLNVVGPLATTSVNISGEAPLESIDEIKRLFGDKIDYYIDETEIRSNVSSTVVAFVDGNYKIIRQGDIKIGGNDEN